MIVNVLLWIAGIALIALGYVRIRGPYARYRAQIATDENLRRYDSWRGTRVADDAGGASGADLMRSMLRRQVRLWSIVLAAGAALLFLGFFIR